MPLRDQSAQTSKDRPAPRDVCPYLGIFQDRYTACHYPASSNACHKLNPPLSVPLSKQGACCLTGGHRGCAVFQERQQRRDVRRRWKQNSVGAASPAAGNRVRRIWRRLRENPWSPRAILTAICVVLLIPLTLMVIQVAAGGRTASRPDPADARVAIPTLAAEAQGNDLLPDALPGESVPPVESAPAMAGVATATPLPAPPTTAPATSQRDRNAAVPGDVEGEPTQITEASPTAPPATPPDGATIYHVVQVNQSLQQLARIYQTTPEEILGRNGLASAAEIEIGDELAIPATAAALTATPAVAEQTLIRHIVQPGEYLSQLVNRYNTSLAAVLAVNPYGNGVGLHPGRVLFIPSSTVSGS